MEIMGCESFQSLFVMVENLGCVHEPKLQMDHKFETMVS